MEKASSSRRGEAGLQLKIRIFSTYFPLVFRKHNEMLQEVIRNYKIKVYLNIWHTESYIKLQQLQHFSSEKWMRAKKWGFHHIYSQWLPLYAFWSVWWATNMYVGRLQIVCKTSEKNGVHRRGWSCLPQNKNRRDDAIAPAVHMIMIPIEKKYIRSKLPLIRVKR